MRHETARIAGLLALAAALVTCAGPLYDDLAEVRTTVEAVEGDVVQVEDDVEEQLEPCVVLPLEARVLTGEQSRAELRLDDGTAIALEAETEVALAGGEITLERGRLRVEAQGPGLVYAGQAEISTPGAVLELETRGDRVEIRVVEGTAVVSTFDEEVTVEGSQAVTVDAAGRITVAQPETGTPPPAQETDIQDARAAFVEGVEAFDRGDFAAAAAAFRRAYDLRPHYAILFNIARCEAELGNYREAKDAYDRFMEESGNEVPAETIAELGAEIEAQLRGRHVRSRVVAGRPLIKGSMPRELVERVVARHLREVELCYDKGLARDETLAGRVAIRFVIMSTGHVSTAAAVESTLGDERVERCIAEAFKRWTFPASDCGGIDLVTYPFELSPRTR